MTLERPSGEIYAVTLTRRPLEARPAPARPRAPARARPAQSCRAKLPRKVAAQSRRAKVRGCGPTEGGRGPGLSGRARARSERSRRSPARESLWLRVRASHYLRRRPAALRPPISCGDALSADFLRRRRQRRRRLRRRRRRCSRRGRRLQRWRRGRGPSLRCGALLHR